MEMKMKVIVEKPGKRRENFSLLSRSEKHLKMPWKSQGKPREITFSKMCPRCILCKG